MTCGEFQLNKRNDTFRNKCFYCWISTQYKNIFILSFFNVSCLQVYLGFLSSFLSLLSLFFPFSFFFPMIGHVRTTSFVDFFFSLLSSSSLYSLLFFHVILRNKSMSPIETFILFFLSLFFPIATAGPNIHTSSNYIFFPLLFPLSLFLLFLCSPSLSLLFIFSHMTRLDRGRSHEFCQSYTH